MDFFSEKLIKREKLINLIKELGFVSKNGSVSDVVFYYKKCTCDVLTHYYYLNNDGYRIESICHEDLDPLKNIFKKEFRMIKLKKILDNK